MTKPINVLLITSNRSEYDVLFLVLSEFNTQKKLNPNKS